MNKAKSLARSLPAVCRALTGQKGIKLVFQGPPRTDGTTIYSNPLPLDADERKTTIITGDIDHECGHILYTDFDYSKSTLARVPENRSGFVHNVQYAIEDTFIERRLGEDYLGCRENLRLSVEYMLEDDGAIPSALPPGEALSHYIDAWGRTNVLGQDVTKLLESLEPQVDTVLGDNGRMRLDALLSQHLYSVDSTKDGFRLTRKVTKLLEDLADELDTKPPEKPDAPSEAGENSSNGTGDPGNDDAAGSSGGKPENQPTPGEQSSDGAGDPSPSGQNKPSPKTGQNSQTSDGAGARQGEIIRQAMENNDPVKPLLDRSKAAQKAAEQALKESPHGEESFTAGESLLDSLGGKDVDAYHAIKDQIRGATHELQRRIVAEYQTLARQRQMVAEEGRLDSRRLHRAMIGDRRIYRHKTKRQLPFPAISVVIDCSGSMKGRKLPLAKQALIAVAEVNQQINVKTDVLAFAGSRVTVVKTFDQPLQTAHAAIGGLRAGGGTPTAEALWDAGLRLAARREERKLMLLVTDGLPQSLEAAQEVAQRVTVSGIELYGIGIGDAGAAVAQFCPKYAVLTGIDHIADAVLDALRSRLLVAA